MARKPPRLVRPAVSVTPPSIIEALADPELFDGMFDAPSWAPWKVFLKALWALPMDETELAVYRRHTARQAAPAKVSRYAELVCGRRGGKSRILSLIAVYLACCLDHRPYLVPGETPVVAIIAKDRDQAKVILGYIVGFLQEIPAFSSMIDDQLTESVKLTNRVTIEVHTASLAAPRGRTFLAVLADEIAFWPSAGDAANQDVEVINAVRPGLATIPYSLLLLASSPHAKRGVLYSNYAKYFGQEEASVLVWQGSTAEMNATLVDDEVARDMFATDPDRAAAEFGGIFRSDIAAFITMEALQAVTPSGVREILPSPGTSYIGFCDPSGGSSDSFSLAIGHLEPDGLAVLDCVREERPPFSSDAVVERFSELLKSYGVSRLLGDAYGGLWPRERFAHSGISYEISPKPKSVIYGEILPSLNAGRVRLLDNPRMLAQFANLERRVARGGRASIDHPPQSHDDVANAAAGCLLAVLEDQRPSLVSRGDLLVDDQPAPEMVAPEVFNCILWVGADGRAAWTLWGFTNMPQPAILLIDFDTVVWSGSLLSDVAQRLDAACEAAYVKYERCRSKGVSALLHCQSQLRDQAAWAMHGAFALRSGRDDAWRRAIGPVDIDEQSLRDSEGLALRASSLVSQGLVKLSATALERAAGRPLWGSLAVKPGERIDSDPLRVSLLLGIVEVGPEPDSPSGGALVRFG